MPNLIELIEAADLGSMTDPPSGVRARQVRVAAGVSPTDVAAAVGIAERTLLGYERDDRQLRSSAARIRLGRVVSFLEATKGAS